METVKKKVLVTGASGFLGNHVVIELLKHNYHVKTLNRSYINQFTNTAVEQIEGSVLSSADISKALIDIDVVVHLAGFVSRDKKDTKKMHDLHVNGTLLLLEEITKLNRAIKVIYASTSGSIACSENSFVIATENSPQLCKKVFSWPYYSSKIEAEKKALELALLRGIEFICLNPSLLLGPGDARLSSTSDLLKLVQGKIPFSAKGGINFVDVRDVASAFVNAIQFGQSGQRYLLGSVNWTLKHFFEHAADLAGKSHPLFVAPPFLTKIISGITTPFCNSFGIEPLLDPISEEMSRCYWYFDNSKAKKELFFTPRPPSETLIDTIEYFRNNNLC